MSEHEHSDKAEETISIKERSDSTAGSDRENDTFEDANDVSPVEVSRPESVERTRSLTQRRSSSVKSTATAEATAVLPVPKTSLDGTTDQKEKVEETKTPSSPLLTSHRISTESLDNVNLEDGAASPLKDTVSKEATKPSLPTRNSKPTLQGLSGVLPSIPWSPPPQPHQSATLPAPAPPTRKLTSPFSWLSRNTSKEPTPPPIPSPNREQRRNTASSVATVGSNSEMMLSKLEEGPESEGTNGTRRPVRNSLRDRFKLLRMREEAGITELPEDENEKTEGGIAALIGRSATMSLGLASPSLAVEKDGVSPSSPHPLGHNPALAPGTAAGVSAGPSANLDSTVDWDLWQAVVDEGPTAVARTSPEELNRAITSGIPNAIRGVVWQILAQSKNEELESVYRDLVARGTDKDKDRMSASSGATTHSGSNYSGNREDTVASSASSVHSDLSASIIPQTNGMRSPSPPKDPEQLAKAQAAALADRKKKVKEDTAALTKLEKAIKRDLGARTSFSKFAASAGLQDGLFGVCKAYALFDEGVGYAQGMNFLAMPLLFNMPEEEAFCLLVRLMNQYHLRDLFIQDMPGLHLHLYQFSRLLEDFEPALYCHLARRQVTPHLYATQWFLTLFAYRFPLQLVLRIYDLILSEGLEAIIKFGIVLMQKNAATLLAMNDMAALTNFLKDRVFDVYIDQSPSAGSILESGFFGSSGASIDKEVYRADQLIQDACAVKITPELLKTYTLEWEEKTRLEKEREAELENLKSTNYSLSLKVRRLEERVEEHDTEHAALATELVRTKVENEELREKNEELDEKVKELRKVVENQPEEVEARLREEMDRLMLRNQEVHGENTRLEEEMGEMEKDLVETKMKYAEVRADHDALNRKWTDLRKALGE